MYAIFFFLKLFYVCYVEEVWQLIRMQCKKKGSFYLQSKVHRDKECLEAASHKKPEGITTNAWTNYNNVVNKCVKCLDVSKPVLGLKVFKNWMERCCTAAKIEMSNKVGEAGGSNGTDSPALVKKSKPVFILLYWLFLLLRYARWILVCRLEIFKVSISFITNQNRTQIRHLVFCLANSFALFIRQLVIK